MTRKFFILILVLCMLLTTTSTVLADKPTQVDSNGVEIGWENNNSACATIASGTIKDSVGHILTTGYDVYGYNYQAHIFNGYYDNFSRPAVLVNSGDKLVMKWSDAWLANVDCNGDGLLDRGLVNGVPTGYSMGWLTNHFEGWYDSDGNGSLDAQYTDFVKIVWTGPGGTLWGDFTIIEEVYNDPVGGYHGVYTKATAPGFGLNDQWTTLP